jgi:predicted CoA-binding protein
MKKTLVLGASSNPERYSFRAVQQLKGHGFPVVALGNKGGDISGIAIDTGKPAYTEIDTVSLYLSAQNQEGYSDYILGLHPKRVIFNPGTENRAFSTLLRSKGIEALEACTLVMLSVGNF